MPILDENNCWSNIYAAVGEEAVRVMFLEGCCIDWDWFNEVDWFFCC